MQERQTGFKEKLVETSYCLDEYFHLVNLVYTRNNKDTKLSENFEQAIVLCKNLPELIDLILLNRQKEHRDSVLIRIGIDGGGFLNICMSIFDIINPFPCVQGGISRKLKESGVKKVFC